MESPEMAAIRVVPILLYHYVTAGKPLDPWTVSTDQLRHHLDLVAETGAHTFRATDYARACRTRSLPDGPIALITFDDAHSGVVDFALPLLAERAMVATLFVTAGMLGEAGNIDEKVLLAIDPAIMEVGSHTMSHAQLDIVRPARLREEIAGSRLRLEDLLGRPVTSLAYPHGYHRRLVCEAVHDAGYETAHAVRNALSYVGDNLYRLARLTVHSDTSDHLIGQWLIGQGAPVAAPGESRKTKAWRQARRLRGRPIERGR